MFEKCFVSKLNIGDTHFCDIISTLHNHLDKVATIGLYETSEYFFQIFISLV